MNFTLKKTKKIHLQTEDKNFLDKNIEFDIEKLLKNQIDLSKFFQLTKQEKTQLLTKLINEYRKKNSIILNIIPVLNARCPVVRFFIKGNNFSKRMKTLSCELSIENLLSEKKANFIKNVIDSDQTGNLRKFFFVIKMWALSNNLFQRNFENQSNTTWKSYILSLLIINFLQIKGYIKGPLIKENSTVLLDWKIEYLLFSENIDNFDLKNNLKAFFVFLYNSIKQINVFCLSQGKIITVDDFKKIYFNNDTYPKKIQDFKFSIINVQDTFELSHNVASNVSKNALSKFRKALMYSIFLMKNDINDIEGLLCISNLETKFSAITANNQERNNQNKKFQNSFTIKLENNSLTSFEIFESFLYLISEILLMNKIDEIKIKKSRQIVEDYYNNEEELQCEKCELNFCVTYPVWNSRRMLRRMQSKKNENLMPLFVEKNISKELKQNASNNNINFFFCVQLFLNKLDSVKSLTINTNSDESDYDELYIVFNVLEKEKNLEEFQNLIHFLSTFIPRFLPIIFEEKKQGILLIDSKNCQNEIDIRKRKH